MPLFANKELITSNLIDDFYLNLLDWSAKDQIAVGCTTSVILWNNNKTQSDIFCNNCSMENIKGIRYKCAQRPNFNLCDNCEKYCQHDNNHIFIKIRKPLKEESELINKINQDLKYKNNEYNYTVNLKDIKINIDNKNNDTLVQQITLKNNGNEPWKAGAVFKCLPDSQIKGNDSKIECKVNKDATVNIELIFDNNKDKLIPSINEYYVYYQMFNNNNEAFGNITKFRVIFQN